MKTYSSSKLTLLSLLLVGAALGTHTSAQEAETLRPLAVDDYFAIQSVGSPIVSPDGAWVVYTVSTKDLENDRT